MKKSDKPADPAAPITPDNQPKAQAVAPPPSAANAAGPYREDPGQTLGIVGLVMNVAGILPAGIVFGVLSRNKSREAGFPTTLGTIAMVWGIVGTVLATLAVLFWIAGMVFLFSIGRFDSTSQPSQQPASQTDYQYSDSSSI